ncbi:MAG: Gfo/Idh/MocA family oxidoreductase [Gammaproteobacteria bacterium]|nr:Gfo/Idh/MocA family oxidoreductase [Gammaproteobacteria bacterium]
MNTINRREVLQGAVAAAGSLLLPYRAKAQVPPSERITIAVIGLGAMGRGHLGWTLGHQGVQVMAVCDVDRERREDSLRRAEQTYADRADAATWKGVKAYRDYREILARDDIDTVLIATPDHWHTPMSIEAAKAGKDIYCEKPISLTIAEGWRLAETMRDYHRIFQTGTQYRSMHTIRRVVQFVRSGGLGKIKQVFTLWSRVEGGYTPVDYALPAEPVPDGLDWDLWVGPAAFPAVQRAAAPQPDSGVVPWAFCEDYGAASITWHHSHAADVVQYALGVERTGPVEVIHPADGKFPTMTLRFANGTTLHLVDNWGWSSRSTTPCPIPRDWRATSAACSSASAAGSPRCTAAAGWKASPPRSSKRWACPAARSASGTITTRTGCRASRPAIGPTPTANSATAPRRSATSPTCRSSCTAASSSTRRPRHSPTIWKRTGSAPAPTASRGTCRRPPCDTASLLPVLGALAILPAFAQTTPIPLNDHERLGQRFTSTRPVMIVAVCVPSWSDNEGGLTITIWDSPDRKQKLAERVATDIRDNEFVEVRPAEAAGSGELLLGSQRPDRHHADRVVLPRVG